MTSVSDLLSNLPIAEVVDEVQSALKSGNVMLHAEPGAGKSTGLPLALMENATASNKIIMLEPRRLAAIGVAERLASQLGEPLGQRIGLRMRGNTTVSNSTVVEVVTEGVLTRMLQSDPMLAGIGLVIFDEFHERSLHADLGLALCLEVQQAFRDDLKLLLMSATLDAEQLGEHLSDATQVYCAGRQHPVNIHWLGQSRDELPVQISSAVLSALQNDTGDVLVFLPGVYEIDKAATMLEARVPTNVEVYRLHGRADAAHQRAATAPAKKAIRRVILSTSIAETSLTIDGVRVVIDAGLERRGRIELSTGATRLETVAASQASATQRAGRAGRTAPGDCYRLWSENDHARRTLSWQAEIQRSDLSPLLMELGQWGVGNVLDLPWLEPPPEAGIARAQMLLESLAIWQDGKLSAHGQAVANLPLHPRIGNMLIWAAKNGASDLGCQLAVLLENDGGKQHHVDIESLLQRKLSKHQQQRASLLKKQLKMSASFKTDDALDTKPSSAVILAQAYPDWIAQSRKGQDGRFVLSCGAGATLNPEDSLSHSAWLVVIKMGGASREARIFLAAQLELEELKNWSPELFATTDYLGWDDKRERVVAEHHTKLGKLIVHTKLKSDLSNTEKAKALLAGVRQRGIQCLPWTDECREWQARVALVKTLTDHCTQLDWPDVSDDALTASLEQWLLVWLEGRSSLKALSQLDLLAILNSQLDYQQQQELEALLPLKYKVPSGSNIKIRYTDTDVPALAVKLQEMFGCVDNPSIAKGHIVLKVELLSPARRPVQLTTDLANFWTSSYPAVKKDLAGRYPKHDWPDNPLEAKPTAFTKNRKKRP